MRVCWAVALVLLGWWAQQALGSGLGPNGTPQAWNLEGRTPSARADGLKGPVKTVLLEEMHVVWDGDTPKEGRRVALSRTTYDERGNRTELIEYRADGAVTYRRTYTYDEQGNWTLETWYDGDERLLWVWKYTNDENGRWMNAELYDDNAQLRESWLYVYDEKGNLIRRAQFNAFGTLVDTTYLEYDEQGRKTEMSGSGHGSTHMLFLYTYDENGRQIHIDFFRAYGPAPDGGPRPRDALAVSSVVVTTDDNGSTAIAHYAQDGTLRTKATVVRDAQGNITKSGREERGQPLRWISGRRHEYDAYGNWIRSAEGAEARLAEDGTEIPTDARYRTITHYETNERQEAE